MTDFRFCWRHGSCDRNINVSWCTTARHLPKISEQILMDCVAFCTDVHAPLMMKLTDFSDHPFLSSTTMRSAMISQCLLVL